jgi:hypothetical protein
LSFEMSVLRRHPLALLALISIAGLATADVAMAFGKTVGKSSAQSSVAEIKGLSTQTVSITNGLAGDTNANGSVQRFGKTSSKTFMVPVKGQWGVRFDVNQNVGRPSGWNDVDAGAYVKITPALRVGGTVGFGQKTNILQPTPADKTRPQSRVRVETTLNF